MHSAAAGSFFPYLVRDQDHALERATSCGSACPPAPVPPAPPRWTSPAPCPQATPLPALAGYRPCLCSRHRQRPGLCSGQTAAPPWPAGPGLGGPGRSHRPTAPHRKSAASLGLSRSFWPIDHSGAPPRVRRDFKAFSRTDVTLNRMSFVGPPAGRQCP